MKKISFIILDSRIGKTIPIPKYATKGSAGLDIRSSLKEEKILLPDENILSPTGIALYIQDSTIAGCILPRSGLGHKYGLVLGNSVGLLDSDYQGELMVSLWNRSKRSFIVFPGMRIAQLVFFPIKRIKLKVVNKFSNVTKRGNKGFGHTGQR
ncbi:dUTP diphosphatase [Buchnera aphidicola (Mindarus keteleerifoliae)]|uniref:dUTP diphosphatase n=1 Tax=Buchnera aphidicola TaxID=9 RepID=UPI0031B6A6EF